MLVQQIQLAVQAGYLNHQILNQPLAPTTLVLLNQLLTNIKVSHIPTHCYETQPTNITTNKTFSSIYYYYQTATTSGSNEYEPWY